MVKKASSLGYAKAQNELAKALKQTSITKSNDRSNHPNNLATKDNNEYRKKMTHTIYINMLCHWNLIVLKIMVYQT